MAKPEAGIRAKRRREIDLVSFTVSSGNVVTCSQPWISGGIFRIRSFPSSAGLRGEGRIGRVRCQRSRKPVRARAEISGREGDRWYLCGHPELRVRSFAMSIVTGVALGSGLLFETALAMCV